MNDEISLLMLWMDLCMSQQSNLKSLTRKTYNNSLIQQPNWQELVLHWKQNQGCSTGEVHWKYLCILALVLIYGPKWTRTKFVIEIAPSLQA